MCIKSTIGGPNRVFYELCLSLIVFNFHHTPEAIDQCALGCAAAFNLSMLHVLPEQCCVYVNCWSLPAEIT